MFKYLVRPPGGTAASMRRNYQNAPTTIRFFSHTFSTSTRNRIGNASRPQLRVKPHCGQVRSYTLWERLRDSYREGQKTIWKDHPILYPSMIIFIITTIGIGVHFVYEYATKVQPYFDRFPKPVSTPLRKAIYYTEIELEPTKALGWYRQALTIADRLGMHPFSNEVLGIRIQIAFMLERAGLVKSAAEVLEKIRADAEEWVSNGRRRKSILEGERAVKRPERGLPTDDQSAQLEKEALAAEIREEALRDDVTMKIHGTYLKLAELYGSRHINDTAKKENALIQAVSMGRVELQRRRDLKLPISKEEGESFLNLTHVATAHNELADLYSRKGNSGLATPLYMQALALIKEDEGPGTGTCAQVVLLNNISSQMAQQAMLPEVPRPDPTAPPISRDQLLHAASQWAEKALDVAAHVKPPVRNAECDQGCQVATYNLGEIAEMQKKYADAKKFYQNARDLAVEQDFEEGIQRADEALQRLQDQK